MLRERVLLRGPVVPGPGRFEKRQAQKPLAVPCGERERRGATSRVADKMETVEAANGSLPKNPLHLGVETEIRRWLLPCVDLEILCDGIDPVSELPSNAAYAGSAGSTSPGRNTTACRADTAREPTPRDVPPQ